MEYVYRVPGIDLAEIEARDLSSDGVQVVSKRLSTKINLPDTRTSCLV